MPSPSLSDRAIALVVEAWQQGLTIGEAVTELRMDRAFIARIYAQKDRTLADWAKDVAIRRAVGAERTSTVE